eukprot:CAMPEP_0185035258 /NCGR_PEP_ID=MMETSP1103-20130426/26327_1 /TAXON_ID=36769 /ORGANISM="Paraphysomonas bandaiensis, Strain Caron Lab Isolate" /LENGTH=719 /DNA_ID=CAMNT_0027572263 /DNA_START=138 /DNA_END=2298 /DNA_ORIENTATION=+
MVEGLMEFSGKFCPDPIEFVVMEKHIWGFYECEPNIWIVVSVENKNGIIGTDTSTYYYKHSPCGVGLVDAIKKMYLVYASQMGAIERMISLNNGWNSIEQVSTLRKRIRKFNRSCAQIEQDIEVLKNRDSSVEDGSDMNSERRSEHLGIRSGAATVEELELKYKEIQEDIEKNEEYLRDIISEDSCNGDIKTCRYTPKLVRRLLKSFLTWYISTGEFMSVSGINSMWGMHFSPAGNPNFHAVARIRKAINTTAGDSVLGSFILHEGQVLWNDLMDCDMLCLYEFIKLQEHAATRDMASQISELLFSPSNGADLIPRSRTIGDCEVATARSESPPTKSVSNSPTVDDTKQKKSRTFPSVRRRASDNNSDMQKKKQAHVDSITKKFRERRGFVSVDWGTVDILDDNEDDSVFFNADELDSKPFICSSTCSEVLSYMCSGERNIWCPRVHVPGNTESDCCSNNDNSRGVAGALSPLFVTSNGCCLDGVNPDPDVMDDDASSFVCAGRALVYREASFLVLVLFPNWEGEFPYEPTSHEISSRRYGLNSSDELPHCRLTNMCVALQKSITAAINMPIPEKVGVKSRLSRSTSSSSYIQKHRSYPSTDVPEGIGFIYSNDCNVAFKAANVYRSTHSPQYAWPTPLSPTVQTIFPQLFHSRMRFPLAAGQVTGCLSAKVVAAINDIMSVVTGSGAPPGCLREACLRVPLSKEVVFGFLRAGWEIGP